MATAKILIVDDDDINVEMLQAYLELEGYAVYSAHSGEQALEIVQQSPPDLILLDVRMNGISGYETCKCLRANPATQHLPVLLVTGYNDERDNKLAAEAGVDDIVFKPIKPTLMLMRVRLLLRLKALYDQLNA